MARFIAARKATLAELGLFTSNDSQCWVHPINEIKDIFGEYHRLMPQLHQYEKRFMEYLEVFDCLQKMGTIWRTPISPEERLVASVVVAISDHLLEM